MTGRLLIGVALLLPQLAAACPVCFGADAEGGDLGRAFNLGIMLLLGVTMGLIGTGAIWFYRIEQRRQAVDAEYLKLMEVVDKQSTPAP